MRPVDEPNVSDDRFALFVYYKVASGDLPAVAEAVRALQARLRVANPGLETGLWRRPDQRATTPDSTGPASLVTVMETYQQAGGVDSGLARLIEHEASALLAGRVNGARHTELFQPL